MTSTPRTLAEPLGWIAALTLAENPAAELCYRDMAMHRLITIATIDKKAPKVIWQEIFDLFESHVSVGVLDRFIELAPKQSPQREMASRLRDELFNEDRSRRIPVKVAPPPSTPAPPKVAKERKLHKPKKKSTKPSATQSKPSAPARASVRMKGFGSLADFMNEASTATA